MALLALFGPVVPPAHAQEATDVAPPDEAVRAYEQAREHYKAGRYPAAIEELERALTLDPDSPELLYNVARVYELMGDLGKAVGYYNRYRDMLPKAEKQERARVDETIARLKGARQYVEHDDPPPPVPAPVPPPPPPVPERGVADAAVWTTLSLSGSALVGAAVTGGLALGRERELRDWVLGEDGGQGQRAALSRQADRLALASDVLLGAGALTALAALVLYVGRSEVKRPSPSTRGVVNVLPAAGRGGAGLQLQGAF